MPLSLPPPLTSAAGGMFVKVQRGVNEDLGNDQCSQHIHIHTSFCLADCHKMNYDELDEFLTSVAAESMRVLAVTRTLTGLFGFILRYIRV